MHLNKISNFLKTVLTFQFFKFLVVGGINTLFGYFIWAVFVFFFKNPYVSVVLATIVAVIFNFFTYGNIVFHSKDSKRLFKFFAVYLTLMVLQMVLLKILNLLGILNTYVAGAILTLPMALLSFFLMRKLVFKSPLGPSPADNSNPAL